MISDFVKSLTRNTWDWLKPRKLVEGIIASDKLAINYAMNGENITAGNYTASANTGEFLCKINTEDILANTNVTANDTVIASGTITAGVVADNAVYKYLVKTLPAGIIALGKSPDSDLMVLYNDFIETKNGYLFKRNPSGYGIIDTRSSKPTVSYYCVGGLKEIKHKPLFNYIYKGSSNSEELHIVDNVFSHAGVTGGFTGLVRNLITGRRAATASVTCVYKWTENGKVYTSNGECILSTTGSDLSKIKASSFTYGETIDDSKNGDIVYTYNGITYCEPVNSFSGSASVTVSNNVSTALNITGKLTKEDLTLLSNLNVTPNSVLEFDDLNLVIPNGTKIVYLLYSSDSNAFISYSPDSSIYDVLVMGTELGGVLEVRVPDKGNATSLNSFVYGKKPTAGDYIYGVIFTGYTGTYPIRINDRVDLTRVTINSFKKIEARKLNAGNAVII